MRHYAHRSRNFTVIAVGYPLALTAVTAYAVDSASSFSGLRVIRCGRPVKSHAWLITDDPRIVTGRGDERITRPKVTLGAIIHDDVHPARDDESGVSRLAGLGASNRLDIIGPPPAGLEDSSAHDCAR
jgi:hypothetical protein